MSKRTRVAKFRMQNHSCTISAEVVRALADKVPEARSVDAALRVMFGLDARPYYGRSVFKEYAERARQEVKP